MKYQAKNKIRNKNIGFFLRLDSMISILIKLSFDISCFENCVDQDQLASQKPADLDLQCFLPTCKYMLMQGNWIKNGK